MTFPAWEGRIWPVVAPERQEDIMERIARKWAKRFKDDLMNMIENGISFFSRQPPRIRFQMYVQSTLETIPLANRRREIEELIASGALPATQGMPILAQLTEREAILRDELQLILSDPDHATNVRAGVHPPPQSAFWKLLLDPTLVPAFVGEYFVRDFHKVAKATAQRWDRADAQG